MTNRFTRLPPLPARRKKQTGPFWIEGALTWDMGRVKPGDPLCEPNSRLEASIIARIEQEVRHVS